MAKTSQIPFFFIFQIKDPLNLKQKIKFYFHKFLGNIVVHIQAKYRKDRVKTREPIRFEKKRLKGGRLGIG